MKKNSWFKLILNVPYAGIISLRNFLDIVPDKAIGYFGGAAESLPLSSRIGFPPIDTANHDQEKLQIQSIRVFVRLERSLYPTTARYLPEGGYWEVDTAQGKIRKDQIIEWWTIPSFGTGTTPPRD
jgi:hypothetical protein